MVQSLFVILFVALLANSFIAAQYIKPNLVAEQKEFFWMPRKKILIDSWLKLLPTIGIEVTSLDVKC